MGFISTQRQRILFLMLTATLGSISCVSKGPAIDQVTGHAWIGAESLFHQDPRWLGSDAALTIPLDDQRTLWLFGDTFVARADVHTRSASVMIRNTVAIQTGMDPRTASLSFHWQQDAEGLPAAFFPDHGPIGYWPGHGIRLIEGPLVIFLYGVIATPGEGLGFSSAGYALAVIDHPDAPVESWNPRIIEIEPSRFDAMPATAVIRDGAYVVALAIRQKGTHAGALVRYPADQLARGIVDQTEWWAGAEKGWVREASIGPEGPAFVLDDAGAECSLHWDARTRSYVHMATYGFGASTIGVRTAPALTGPWSTPTHIYRPPESDGPKPFVYAAKAHPELIGPDANDLVITYATNSFEFADLFTEEGSKQLYWPRVITLPMHQK